MDDPTILVVEDDAGSRFVLTRLLEMFNCHVIDACDGQAALDLLALYHIDVIISDINMPAKDGLELAREVRRHPEYSRIGLLAVSANDHRLSRELAMRAGFDEFFSKPIRISEILRLIRKLQFEHDDGMSHANRRDQFKLTDSGSISVM